MLHWPVPLSCFGATKLAASATISPDGHWAVTDGSDGTAQLWNLRIDELVTRARQITSRELTEEAEEQYLNRQTMYLLMMSLDEERLEQQTACRWGREPMTRLRLWPAPLLCHLVLAERRL